VSRMLKATHFTQKIINTVPVLSAKNAACSFMPPSARHASEMANLEIALFKYATCQEESAQCCELLDW
jgi:hypothetical protein